MSSLVPKEWEITAPPPAPYTVSYVINNSKIPSRSWKLHPRHQRYDYTWSDENRVLYIDSLEKNIAQASTITLSIKRDSNGVEHVYILDGGHRIDTIKRFCGEMGKDKMFRDAYERLYSDFNDEQKLLFDGKQVTVVTYMNLTDAQEDLIFMRINRNLALSQGETINAMKSLPICSVTHELSEIYKDVMLEKPVGLARCDGSRMEEKAYMFVLCVNFLKGKIDIYEKPGTKVLTIIEKYRDIPMPSVVEMANLKKHMALLFSLFDVDATRKICFYNVIVAQWLIFNSPGEILAYKRFMKLVHMKNSIWTRPWLDAVKDSEEGNQSRTNGIDQKNLDARVSFFREKFLSE